MTPPPRPPEALPDEAHQTHGSVFEGLFARALRPEDAFADALRAAGYDPARPLRSYPTRVWQDCVAVARAHAFGQLGPEAADRALGRAFVEGFLRTLMGRMLWVALPVLGPHSALAKLERGWSAAQPHTTVRVERRAEGHWHVTLRERGILPNFCAGILEGLLQRAGTEPHITVVSHVADACELEVRWGPRTR